MVINTWLTVFRQGMVRSITCRIAAVKRAVSLVPRRGKAEKDHVSLFPFPARDNVIDENHLLF